MIIGVEATVSPGEHALFVTQFRVERSSDIYAPDRVWWGLWLAWWLLPWRKRREWLWSVEKHDERGAWYTWTVMCLGFQITWQLRRRLKG